MSNYQRYKLWKQSEEKKKDQEELFDFPFDSKTRNHPITHAGEAIGGAYAVNRLTFPTIETLLGTQRLHHGTSNEGAKGIREKGLDPQFGGKEKGNTMSFDSEGSSFVENAKNRIYVATSSAKGLAKEHALNNQMKSEGKPSYYEQLMKSRKSFEPELEELQKKMDLGQESKGKLLREAIKIHAKINSKGRPIEAELAKKLLNPFAKQEGTVIEAYIPHDKFKKEFELDPDTADPGSFRSTSKIDPENIMKNKGLAERFKKMWKGKAPNIFEHFKSNPSRLGTAGMLMAGLIGGAGVSSYGTHQLYNDIKGSKKEAEQKDQPPERSLPQSALALFGGSALGSAASLGVSIPTLHSAFKPQKSGLTSKIENELLEYYKIPGKLKSTKDLLKSKNLQKEVDDWLKQKAEGFVGINKTTDASQSIKWIRKEHPKTFKVIRPLLRALTRTAYFNPADESITGSDRSILSPGVLAHELGHRDIHRNSKVTGNFQRNNIHYQALGGLGGTLGSYAATQNDDDSLKAGLTGAGIGAVANAPQLAYEFDASRRARNAMNSTSMSPKLKAKNLRQLALAYSAYIASNTLPYAGIGVGNALVNKWNKPPTAPPGTETPEPKIAAMNDKVLQKLSPNLRRAAEERATKDRHPSVLQRWQKKYFQPKTTLPKDFEPYHHPEYGIV